MEPDDEEEDVEDGKTTWEEMIGITGSLIDPIQKRIEPKMALVMLY